MQSKARNNFRGHKDQLQGIMKHSKMALEPVANRTPKREQVEKVIKYLGTTWISRKSRRDLHSRTFTIFTRLIVFRRFIVLSGLIFFNSFLGFPEQFMVNMLRKRSRQVARGLSL